ncbi:MAG: class I SAM-dependent methyltransferase [Planctomycetota bacterium]
MRYGLGMKVPFECAGLGEQLSALLKIGNEVWAERPDLQEAFPAGGAAAARDYWYWLNWHGTQVEHCRRAEEIRGLLPAFPPEHLAGRVFGEESNARDFVVSGLVNWRRFLDCLEAAGGKIGAGMRLLDFGAGCGRILRNFAPEASAIKLQACDVDAESMRWVSENLPVEKAQAVPHLPPTEMPGEHFDFVYAYSVFSHLTEEASRMWLAEIQRILKPGGWAILTTQGRHVGKVILNGERSHPFPNAKTLKPEWKRFESEGFLFFPYGEVSSNLAENSEFFGEWDLEAYGSTFVSPAYVERVWTEFLDLQALHEAPDAWQDFVVLQKRTS